MRTVVSEGFLCIELNPERWKDWEEFDWDFLENVTEYDFVPTIALGYGHHILITCYEPTAEGLKHLEALKEQVMQLFGDDALLPEEDEESNPEAGQ